MEIYIWWMKILFCAESAPPTPQTTDPPPPSWQPLTNHGEAGKYCCLCGAWFNNPLMAQQHYEGKKHKRNAARSRLLEQLAGSLDANESTGQSSITWGLNVMRLITFWRHRKLCELNVILLYNQLMIPQEYTSLTTILSHDVKADKMQTVVLLNTFEETMTHFFRTIWGIESSKERLATRMQFRIHAFCSTFLTCITYSTVPPLPLLPTIESCQWLCALQMHISHWCNN